MILNRLIKNWKKLSPWASRYKIEAFRLYDRDIPEFPFIIDIYLDFAVIYDKSDEFIDKNKNQLPEIMNALEAHFKYSPEKIIYKKRRRQEGLNQYEKLDTLNKVFTVRESEALFEINLYDYLDSGLFLDHRPMRQRVYKDVLQLKKESDATPKVLNLFCYTGSVSVFAALGGAEVTSVDMSATYIEWAQRNFQINHLELSKHHFVQKDALQYLEQVPTSKFDLIFLDPPTFSNSKRMLNSFDVERDQALILKQSMQRLNRNGTLYFSNNKRNFKLESKLSEQFDIKDITKDTIPQDFHDQKIHTCFRVRFKKEL